MKKVLIAVVLVAGFAAAASAATINYDLKVNGSDGPVDVLDGSTFLVEVYANVPDVDFGSGIFGGLLQSNYDLQSSGGIPGLVEAVEGIGGPPLFEPDGHWDSTSEVVGMTNYKGAVNAGGMDVLSQASQFSPGDFGTNYNTVGAGPGVWTLITSGNFTCLGLGTTTLSLVPGPLDGQLVYGLGGGAEYPTVANGDSVEITQTPEPATMAFLGLGVCGVLFRRRR